MLRGTDFHLAGAQQMTPSTTQRGAFSGFNGELPERATGHYLLGNGYRAYNPVLMRFNSPDSCSPFGRGGVNAYAYCVGDPVNRRDPTGHFSWQEAVVMGMIKLFGRGRKTVEIAQKAVTRSPQSPPYSPARQHIETSLAKVPDPSPFSVALRTTNANLASHGDTSLTLEHAKAYVVLAQRVNSGVISNTTAHVLAAMHWSRTGGVSGDVGAAFNAAAALFSGGVDAVERKTGQVIRRGNGG